MRFHGGNELRQWYYSCQIKCRIETSKNREAHETCSGKFVDCSRYGGYDPTDPCHQTCNSPRTDDNYDRDDGTEDNQEDSKDMDVHKSGLKRGIHKLTVGGKKLTVKCEGTPIKCHTIGSKKELDIPDQEGVADGAVHMSHARAPNGAYWKFDCNWIQRLIFENCWEGDDGEGNECTIWDKLLFKKCYDTAALFLQPQTMVAMATLVYTVTQ